MRDLHLFAMARKAKSRRSRSRTLRLGQEPARRGGLGLAVVLASLLMVNLYVFLWRDGTSVPDVHKAAIEAVNEAPGEGAGSGATGSTDSEGPAAAPSVLDGVVEKGDSLGKILKRAGLGAAEADELIRALSAVLDFRAIRAGQTFRIERGPDGQVDVFELELSKVQVVRAIRNPAGELIGVSDKAQTRVEVKQVGGTIDSSLYAAIKSAGEETALVAFFVDVFAYDLDFYNDTHDGDTFRVVVEKEYKDQEFLRYKRILAAEYRGKAGQFRAFYWQAPGAKTGRYFDERGQSLEKSMLKTPLKFARISSGFDRKRMHPVLHRTRAHLGIDYAAPTGTPVWAAAPGKITSRGPAGGAGNMVAIQHDSGLTTLYMHLSRFAGGLKVGDRIDAKTVIGYVGTTGLSTGPHLHFGVKKGGIFIDPSKLAPTRLSGVAKKDQPAFAAAIAERVTQLESASVEAVTATAQLPAAAPLP
jgi:murein DD-endopeptidase MepM/ murein hydrolase activator NlpD